MAIQTVFDTAVRGMGGGFTNSEIRALAQEVVNLNNATAEKFAEAGLEAIGVSRTSLEAWETALRSPMPLAEAARHVANNKPLFDRIDSAANGSGVNGTFSDTDLRALLNLGELSPTDFRACKSLLDNYQTLLRYVTNAYRLPDMPAVEAAAGIVRNDPKTVKGAAAIIVANQPLLDKIDAGANGSGVNGTIGRPDMEAVYNLARSSMTANEQVALKTLIDNFDAVQRASLRYAPNPYQLLSQDGLREIARRGV